MVSRGVGNKPRSRMGHPTLRFGVSERSEDSGCLPDP